MKQKGVTIWLTGLSASGKVGLLCLLNSLCLPYLCSPQSTIACALEQHLLHLQKFAYRLDGDNIRFGLNKDLGFDEKSRNENIRRIGEVREAPPHVLLTDQQCGSDRLQNSSRTPPLLRSPPLSPLTVPTALSPGNCTRSRASPSSRSLWTPHLALSKSVIPKAFTRKLGLERSKVRPVCTICA